MVKVKKLNNAEIDSLQDILIIFLNEEKPKQTDISDALYLRSRLKEVRD